MYGFEFHLLTFIMLIKAYDALSFVFKFMIEYENITIVPVQKSLITEFLLKYISSHWKHQPLKVVLYLRITTTCFLTDISD